MRMDHHVHNAQIVAEHLESHSQVKWVNYAGLKSSKYYELGRKYLPKGPGAVFSFGIDGGYEAGVKFVQQPEAVLAPGKRGRRAVAGDPPSSTTHQQLSAEQQKAAGVTGDMIRLSVGLEDLEDLLWDLNQALEASK